VLEKGAKKWAKLVVWKNRYFFQLLNLQEINPWWIKLAIKNNLFSLGTN
jgi:hypothetical protein